MSSVKAISQQTIRVVPFASNCTKNHFLVSVLSVRSGSSEPFNNQFEPTASKPFLHNTKNDWFQFKDLAENGINVNIPLRSLDDIECAIEDCNFIVQNAASGNKDENPRKEKD